MEKISEMIERMCPEGVNWVKLNELCIKICSGGTPSRGNKDYFTGNIPWLRTQEVDWKDIYDTEIKITEDAVKRSSAKLIDKNCVIIAMYGATAGKAAINKIPITTNQACCNLQIDPQKALYRYVYYWICCQYENIKSMGQGSQNNINAQILKDYPIPLPPLPIQQEIVRILDSFTQLQSNLEAELAARQKQYEYYRNKLLTFDENDESVEWKTLGEIGTMYKGKGIQKADFVEDGMPCIHYGQVHTFYGFSATETKSFISEEMYSSSNKAKKGDIIIATTSEDVEACCKSTVWLGDSEPAISGDAHYFRHNQNPKYIGYLFMTEMFASQKRTAAVGAKVTRVHGDSILKFKFPFPSLAYQQEVAEKLDNFEALIANIKQEIGTRKKQYEYYREQLLTFE